MRVCHHINIINPSVRCWISYQDLPISGMWSSQTLHTDSLHHGRVSSKTLGTFWQLVQSARYPSWATPASKAYIPVSASESTLSLCNRNDLEHFCGGVLRWHLHKMVKSEACRRSRLRQPRSDCVIHIGHITLLGRP